MNSLYCYLCINLNMAVCNVECIVVCVVANLLYNELIEFRILFEQDVDFYFWNLYNELIGR